MGFPGHSVYGERVSVIRVVLVGVEFQVLDVISLRVRSRQKLIQRASVLNGELAFVLDLFNSGEKHVGDLFVAIELDGAMCIFDLDRGFGGEGA